MEELLQKVRLFAISERACGECGCEALEELLQKVRLFAISDVCFFAFATFANLEGLEDKERLFATYRSNF